MSYFSGKVLLGDLDDFIAPAQACSTGLFSDSGTSTHRGAQLVMEDDLGESFEFILCEGFKNSSSKANVIRSSAAKIATVTLEDCLACRWEFLRVALACVVVVLPAQKRFSFSSRARPHSLRI